MVSLLNEPNTFSPANVDASVMFRRWKESKGKDKEYEHIIRSVTTSHHAHTLSSLPFFVLKALFCALEVQKVSIEKTRWIALSLYTMNLFVQDVTNTLFQAAGDGVASRSGP